MIRLGVAFVLCVALRADGASAERRVAIILDTSGSMDRMDQPRYSVQLTKVLSDLLAADQRLTVVRLPKKFSEADDCDAGAESSLTIQLDSSDRSRFKSGLDRFIDFGGGNNFTAPVRSAIEALGTNSEHQRLLLMIGDSGGLGECATSLTADLVKLRDSDAMIAAINIGSDTGAFETNPAFAFTTAAGDAEALVRSVGLVYQRFLGAKGVRTGRVHEVVEVEVDPYVRTAYLVVAADGPVRALSPDSRNPPSDALDPDVHGGGETIGLDGRTRGYRIARMVRPAAGVWRFQVPGLADVAGWMLVQEFAVAIKLVAPGPVPRGTGVTLELEVVDAETGQRLTGIPGLSISVPVGGRIVEFGDDGSTGDRAAGDGVFSARIQFEEPGTVKLPVRITSDVLDTTHQLEIEVVESSWRISPRLPAGVEVDSEVLLVVDLEQIGDRTPEARPEYVEARLCGHRILLRDDGSGGDEVASDSVLSGRWTPDTIGHCTGDLVADRGPVTPARASVEVVGSLSFGAAVPIAFGSLRGDQQASATLDLSTARVRGTTQVIVQAEVDWSGARLEIDPGTGWVQLDRRSVALPLAVGGARTWPLRVVVERCPGAVSIGAEHFLEVTGTGVFHDRRLRVPVTVEIAEDPWLDCWWPVLALAVGLAVAAFVIHGYWVPSRFKSRVEVWLSPEEDLAEGFGHPIRATRGSGAGFRRDARVYICADFRLSSRPTSAIARLRADGHRILIKPSTGVGVLRRTIDGEWQPLPADETSARIGDLYCSESQTLFFAVRNG